MDQAVEYFHEITGVGYGNIMWKGAWPMRYGKFPSTHPAPADKMQEFCDRGYYASPFPEGDGITMHVERGQKAAQVARDISEVFGWRVIIKRGDPE